MIQNFIEPHPRSVGHFGECSLGTREKVSGWQILCSLLRFCSQKEKFPKEEIDKEM